MKEKFLLLFSSLLLSTTAAAAISWHGYKGLATLPPAVSTVKDTQKGDVVRIECVDDGTFQGTFIKFSPAEDLSKYAAVEFDLRHNLTKSSRSFVIRFEQNRGMIYRSFITPSDKWAKITIPLDAAAFTPASGNTVVFDKTHEVRLYPYEAMSKKGEFLEIANFRFIPKSDSADVKQIKVMSYRHLTAPTSGDSENTALTNGNKTDKVHFRMYSEEPHIEFDLGGRYAIDRIEVDAVSAPSHNFSEILISSSSDGKNWSVGGGIKNNKSGISEKLESYRFVPGDRPIVGRYIRFLASRPRSDFPVNLSEVTFFGHTPSEKEILKAAELNYDTGKPMPKRNDQNYFILKNQDWKLFISKNNGVVNGAYYKGKLLVERFSPRYTMQTRSKDTEISGYDDVVKSVETGKNFVTVTTTNKNLPGLEIERTWKIEKNAVYEKVTVINKGQRQRVFLRIATEVILEQNFRKDGFYEMPSSALADGMFRLPASDVQMDRSLTNIPTLAIENGKTNQTVWHTRYRFNDRFSYYNIGTEEENLQFFRANGWMITSATIVPADKARQSVENRFSVTGGRMLKAYEEYINLPEVAAFRGQIKRPAWLRDVKVTMAFGWDGNYPASSKRLMQNYMNVFSKRGKLVEFELVDMDGIWGDLPIKGPVRGSFGECRDATEIRQRVRDIRATDPRFTVGIYTWFWSAFPWSTPVKNHPEWFVKTLRNGAKSSWFPGVNVNYLRFWGIKESRDEAVNQIVNFINYYEQDSWYLDGGKSGTYAKCWDTMRIDDMFGQTDFYLAVRNKIQKTNPNRIVMFNHAENPIGDMGTLESFGGTLTNEWRRGATLMWKFKMYNYKDPLHNSIYTYWLPGVDGAYHNYLAGISQVANYNSRAFGTQDVPFLAARYGIRMAQINDADVKPDWRFDFKEELECMTLNQLNNGWIFMHYHGNTPVVREVSADTAALGLRDKNKPLYMWRYVIRDARKYKGRFGEQQISQGYAQSSWISERAASVEFLGKQPYSERVSGKLEQYPGVAQLLMVSQVPAVVVSVAGDPAHYYLAGQPDVTVDGDRNQLVINSEVEKAEIGMILEDGELPEKIMLNGKETEFKLRVDGKLRLAVFTVDKGNSAAKFSYRKSAPVKTESLEFKRYNRILEVRVKPATANVSIYSDGALVLSKTGSFAIRLPETARDGEYQIVSGDIVKKFTLRGMQSPLRLLPILLPLPDNKAVKAVNRKISGIEVLNQAHCFSVGAGKVNINLDKLSLQAGTIPYFESHFNNSSAALEMKVKSYLKLRIINGVIHHSRYAYTPQHHFVRSSHPGTFAGLIIDFGSAAGYKVRSAAGFGHQHEARKNGQPRPEFWGKKASPDNVYELNNLLHDADKKAESVECWIDLASLGAPADWNGKIWLTMHTEHISPDRGFKVEILETANQLPAGVNAVSPLELGVTKPPVVYQIPRIKGKAVVENIPVTGKLNPDKNAVKVDTEVRAAYDDKNLYLFFDCRETDGHIPDCQGGAKGSPWLGDGVEFFIQHTDNPEVVLHAVIDAEKAVYAATSPFRMAPGKKNQQLGKIPFTFKVTRGNPHWQCAVTIPWSAVGGKPAAGKEIGFNMMRNRIEQGNMSYYTLSNDLKYFSANQCRMILK